MLDQNIEQSAQVKEVHSQVGLHKVLQVRPSYQHQLRLLKIYQQNQKRQKSLKTMIQSLKPKIIDKKLAHQLAYDGKGHIIQYIPSDDEQQFDDLGLDLKTIKQDYNKKKQVLDDLQKNKYATLQKASIRKVCENQLYHNKVLHQAIKNQFKIKSYFSLSQINKFGVFAMIGPHKYLVKFVSVGLPDKIIDSLNIDFEVSEIYSNKRNLLILVSEDQAQLYDLDTKEFILKTHKHQTKIVYAGFAKLDIQSILTVTEDGVIRLFDIMGKSFYWIGMTDPIAKNFLLKQDKIYYSIQKDLYWISLKTKEIGLVGSCSKQISVIHQTYFKAQNLFFNMQNNSYQTSIKMESIVLDKNVKYHVPKDSSQHLQKHYLLVNSKKIPINLNKPILIDIYSIKVGGEIDRVALFGGADGQLEQISIKDSS